MEHDPYYVLLFKHEIKTEFDCWKLVAKEHLANACEAFVIKTIDHAASKYEDVKLFSRECELVHCLMIEDGKPYDATEDLKAQLLERKKARQKEQYNEHMRQLRRRINGYESALDDSHPDAYHISNNGGVHYG